MADTSVAIDDLLRRMTPVSAPPEQREELTRLFRLLDRFLHGRDSDAPAIRLVSPEGETVPLPDTVVHVLERIAEIMARGDALSVVPVSRDLTTQQAADILDVSRQYLVRLLDDNRIPSTRTGTHRRVRVQDVLAFKERRDRERMMTLDELTELSQDAGGYQEIP